MSATRATAEPGRAGDSPADDGGLGSVFFEGLPAMAAIVTVISQPFAQDTTRAMLRLPEWLPMGLALLVSVLLALHRVWVVRRSDPVRCAILVPLMALVIFSAYATGNNLVYYAKEGYARPQAPPGPAQGQLDALARERDLLKQQLASAQELIGGLRAALNLPDPAGSQPRSAVPSLLALLPRLSVGKAHAQQPLARPQPGPTRPETAREREIREALEKYETQQRRLGQEIEQLRREEEQRARETQQQRPLIKSW